MSAPLKITSQDPVSRWLAVSALVASFAMGTLLTKRRAVDLCRVATCLCPRF